MTRLEELEAAFAAVENAGRLKDFIEAHLALGFHRKLIDLGYWCLRCDVLAAPRDSDNSDAEGGDGWCMFCGRNPLVEGPKPVPYLRGIMS